MLVITRKKGESLLIGDNIEVSISKIEDGSVKLAVKAPKEVTILRKELFKEVESENIEATKISIDILKSFKK
ncbi:carbon storage regulator CsrA [Clostridium chauvoei]|uniref:Translational regulator CsrA n=2 Tax=Clostridium chauvoei TaxID=46867 RepID=S6F888_9CLOT|nr:carbon storage regulator CsrA [Clostridium chauvoei]ATD54619.1 carbon storage regulator [Clostridium chauvoei]ATD57700.1 carbon storage regulator [Clostridium chauvoei]MBX7281031.1 carbon storage regulator CsrA [Clostridium chauvoei]MBX7283468.1 carbon storage regulator CsrA [Clostridium chauvoei]MBX7286120.1 carbon storage regulator CsrA [Clostridium chauvoei]